MKCSVLILIFTLQGCTNDDHTNNNQVLESKLNTVNTWTYLPDMPVYRYDSGFEIYQNKIYALGGFSWDGSKSASDQGDIFDLETKKWTKTTKLLKESEGVTSTQLNGKIYLIGGRYSNSKIQIYDIATNSWKYGVDFPLENFYWGTAQTYNDKIYVMGGYVPSTTEIQIKSTMYIFDLKLNKWILDSIPSDLVFPNSVKFEDKFYLWSSGVIYSYQPETKIWNEIASGSKHAKANQEAIVYKNRIIFIGGSDSTHKDSPTSTDITIFDPKLDKWTITSSTINHKRHYGFGVFSRNNEVFILGGREAGSWEGLNKIEYISTIEID